MCKYLSMVQLSGTTLRSKMVEAAASVPAVAKSLEAVGAHTVCDKVDRARSGGDIVAVRLPAGPGQLRSRRLKLLRRHGTDLAVEAMARDGWLGFERPLPDVLVGSVRRFGGALFDVGANTGLYSLAGAAAAPRVAVHAFEAFPPVLELLVENLALQRCSKRIKVVGKAVTDIDGTLSLYVPRFTGAVETSCSLDPNFKDDVTDKVDVPAITLDTYWETCGRPQVCVVKIDTEGTEHRVLAGAQLMTESQRPVIFYEFLPRGDAGAIARFAASNRMVDMRLRPTEAVVSGGGIEFDGDAWNHALVPEEKLAAFGDVLCSVGVRLSGTAT